MAQSGKETIAANGSQQLTLSEAGKGLGAKRAYVGARGGDFSYNLHGDDAVADTWYPLPDGEILPLETLDQLTRFRIIRDVNGAGTLYVTYYDNPSLKANLGWE